MHQSGTVHLCGKLCTSSDALEMSETGAHHVSQGPVDNTIGPHGGGATWEADWMVGVSKHWLSLVYSTLYYLATIVMYCPQLSKWLIPYWVIEAMVPASIKKCGLGLSP